MASHKWPIRKQLSLQSPSCVQSPSCPQHGLAHVTNNQRALSMVPLMCPIPTCLSAWSLSCVQSAGGSQQRLAHVSNQQVTVITVPLFIDQSQGGSQLIQACMSNHQAALTPTLLPSSSVGHLGSLCGGTSRCTSSLRAGPCSLWSTSCPR